MASGLGVPWMVLPFLLAGLDQWEPRLGFPSEVGIFDGIEIFGHQWYSQNLQRKEMSRYILWERRPRHYSPQCCHLPKWRLFSWIFHIGFDHYSSRDDVTGEVSLMPSWEFRNLQNQGQDSYSPLVCFMYSSTYDLFIPENFIGYSFHPFYFCRWDESVL